MKRILATVFLISIIVITTFGQQDIKIGTSYQLNLQRQNVHCDAWILHNAEYSQSTDILKWENTHSSFGVRGIRFAYSSGRGIYFYADDNASSAGSEFTPTTRFFIGNNGKIGIGTTSPSDKLSVASNISGYTSMISLNELTNNGNNSMGIDWKFAGNAGFPWGSTGRIEVARQSTSSSFDMIFNIANVGVLSEKMRILANGNIGIGTSLPTEKLTIASNISGYTSMISLNELTNNGVNSMGIDWKFAGASGYPWGSTGRIEVARQNTSSSFNMIFNTASLGVLSEKMRILANGSIGIGTTNPGTYKLAVEGVIGACEVVVTTDGWSDFVFEPAYKLIPLENLEQFIKQNKHLPDVPSAEEVRKNGISLGQNHAILLQKIEELTLYMIEQNKKNETQSKEIELLKQEIEMLKMQDK